MSDTHAPSDGQKGDPLAGLALFPPAPGRRPTQVVGVGVRSAGYLNRGILWEVFSPSRVSLCPPDSLGPLPDGCALVWDSEGGDPGFGWSAFLKTLGSRQAVIDIRAAAAMMRRDGADVAVLTGTGRTDGETAVFRSRLSAPVYPAAPSVTLTDSRSIPGLAAGDVIHLYGWNEKTPVLAAFASTEGLNSVLQATRGIVFGKTTDAGHAALLQFPAPDGGRATVMDLRTADRVPEPSGSETPATHILLAALGVTTVSFGKFCRAYAGYDDFVAAVRGLADRYPTFAGLEEIGRSEAGRPLYMLTVARDRRAPALLVTCGIHPMEWGPIYGILRYVRFLLEGCAADTPYTRDLLGDRKLCWVISACPDGWEDRQQQPSGINLLYNFPGTWERIGSGDVVWDAYNRRFAPQPSAEELQAARGPAPASAPETQALMRLLERNDLTVSALADFHETTAPKSFLHQAEREDGRLYDAEYHKELVNRIATAYNGRFYANLNTVAYRPALPDFATWTFRGVRCLDRLIPGMGGWIDYASNRGIPSAVVEAAGSDCTHYQTIRRTEFGAVACEQILAAQCGGLMRNPWSDERTVTAPLLRPIRRLSIHAFDADGRPICSGKLAPAPSITLRLPPGGLVRWRHH